jgi:hypothetical protein
MDSFPRRGVVERPEQRLWSPVQGCMGSALRVGESETTLLSPQSPIAEQAA